MYLMNRYGFFAFGCAYSPDGQIDGETVCVKAGSAQALEALCAEYSKLRFFQQEETDDARFPVQLLVPRMLWARVMEQLALDLTEPLPVATPASTVLEMDPAVGENVVPLRAVA